MKKIYLDVCTLCRPYDDQSYTRIHLETIAVQLILASIEKGFYSVIYSPVHEYEISSIEDDVERIDLLCFLSMAGENIVTDKQKVRKRAEMLVDFGLGIADAAHVAYAETVNADFITCDDKLHSKCRSLELGIWTGNPIVFCDKEALK